MKCWSYRRPRAIVAIFLSDALYVLFLHLLLHSILDLFDQVRVIVIVATLVVKMIGLL